MVDKVKIDLDVLLPEVDGGDQCVRVLTAMLGVMRGIQYAHVKRNEGAAELCLHFDANLISLDQVQRMAESAGAMLSDRYRHETIPLAGMNAADVAGGLARALEQLPGMLHAQVNYAASLAFVAYDGTMLQRLAIEQVIRRMGVRVLTVEPAVTGTEEEQGHHDHGSAPVFLPHWMQERWSLILLAVAGIFLLAGWLGEHFLGLAPTVSLACFIVSYVTGGYDIAIEAIPGLLKGRFNTDMLMLAAAAGAAVLGQWPEGAFLLCLFSLGHVGEHYAMDRARNAVNALGALMPKMARVKQGEQIVERDVSQLRLGDVVVVRPGDRLPADGSIISGTGAIDQSPITGESVPVQKQPGDEVFAGTVNQDAALEIKVTKLARDNTLSRVMQLVAEAQSQQSPTQQFTERFTAKFVPAVLIAVVVVIVAPPLLGLMPLSDSFYRGMLLLVAASPCALAVGTPAAVLSGIAQAARSGVLVKGGVHLETLGGLSAIAFDKTGTLTEGQFAVTDIIPSNGVQPDDVLRMAAAVEQQSSHPLAQAVVHTARGRGLDLPAASGLENLAGRGVRSSVGGQPVLIGSLKLFRETDGHDIGREVGEAVDRLESAGKTTMAVSRNGKFLGVLGLADTLRPSAVQALQRLRQMGIRHLVMLTGDNSAVANLIAQQAGVTDVQAELLPEDKLRIIKELRDQFGPIAMIGDGVNDAPALATADVGIAMGGAGTAVALETADVALMGDDISKLPFAVGLSRASRVIIKQNLIISLGVIGFLILTSVFGLVQLSFAVILHEGSTIVVVLNALRLLRYRD